MKQKLIEEIQRLGGDAGDPMWQWFINNGPHGPSFTWGQTRNMPPGYVGVEHLEEIVCAREKNNPSFRNQAKSVIQKALLSKDVHLLQRAVQVASVLGGEAELRQVSALAKHENESVAAHARASAFYLKRRLAAKN